MIEPGESPWRWVVLAVGTLSQAATCSFIYGIPMVVPALRQQYRLSLPAATVAVSAPIAGLLLTLVLWGAAADRFGEKVVIGSGVTLSAGLLLAAAAVAPHPVALCVALALAGAAGASVNAASGRVVMGWFSARQRGLAMGTRQTAQPLGVALAALALPPLAHGHGVGPALLFPAGLCAVLAAAVWLLVADPPRPARRSGAPARSPYRESGSLVRIHAASTLLVLPQFAVATFTLVYLVGKRHWDPVTAGQVVFGFQVVGAAGRIGSGIWSDRVGSRLRPMRQLAVLSAVLMALLAIGAAVHGGWIVAVFAVAAVITVADNGLAYTSVAEIAGPLWAGRALGIHNTAQNLASVVTAPLLGLVIGNAGHYPAAFALVLLAPLLAVPLTPVAAEGRRDDSGSWRRMRDLNPRGVAPNTISNRAP